MNTENVGAGRLKRRVRRVGRDTRQGVSCLLLLAYRSFVGIAVGRPVTRPPPHRSRRAELPHRAPPCHSLGTRHTSSQKIWHIFGSGTLKYSSSSAKPVQL